MFDWLRRRRSPPPSCRMSTPSADDPSPKGRYAREFLDAWDTTERLGLRTPAIQLAGRKASVDIERAEPVLRQYFGRYPQDEVVGQAFAINTELMPKLRGVLGVPLTLTMGWFDYQGTTAFEHDEAFLGRLLQNGVAGFTKQGLPLHVWLTSPAFEIIDVTLPTTLTLVNGSNLVGRALYLSGYELKPRVIYHPTVLGEDFLRDIGAGSGVRSIPDGRLGNLVQMA